MEVVEAECGLKEWIECAYATRLNSTLWVHFCAGALHGPDMYVPWPEAWVRSANDGRLFASILPLSSFSGYRTGEQFWAAVGQPGRALRIDLYLFDGEHLEEVTNRHFTVGATLEREETVSLAMYEAETMLERSGVKRMAPMTGPSTPGGNT